MHKDISIWMPLYIGDLQAKFARMTVEQSKHPLNAIAKF